jgi:hypothetical protein
MPQLDNVTYLSQIFWCFITFSTLYFVLLKNILPNIAKVLKIRNRLLNYYNNLFKNLNDINNSYVLNKSTDLSNLFSFISKNITVFNNEYRNINNNEYLNNYLRNYPFYFILVKLNKVLINNK